MAVLGLGIGQYGAVQLNAGEGQKPLEVPTFYMGSGSDVDAWFKKTFKRDFASSIKLVKKTRKKELADCLDSFLVGDRKAFEAYRTESRLDPAHAREAWHETNRSSMNDIGRKAWNLARDLRG